MKNSLFKVLLSSVLLLSFTSAFSQEVEWKHYEYPDINLQFDLPADFVFDYPEEGGLSFVGYNNWVKFTFRRIEKAITGDDQRRAELYKQVGYDGANSDDGSFMSGTTANGYYMAGTVGVDLETNQETLLMMLSDPGNNTLNFLISTTYGGEINTDSVAYRQAGKIIMNFGPIVK
jgi:hypothetical protein